MPHFTGQIIYPRRNMLCVGTGGYGRPINPAHENDYQGGYDQVRRYVASKRRGRQETFVPLAHEPGSRVECDFGHIYVDFPDGRRQVPVLLLTWSYSHHCFAMALPSEKAEAILHGTVCALEYFDCVPREMWWDNPRTVATEILIGRQRRIHERYRALASHYNFEPLFCQPARGNEKPDVENRVKRLQRTWATPVPQVADLAELNDHLRRCLEAEPERTVQRTDQSIGARFAQERDNALSIPKHRFDPCVRHVGVVDKYQTVRHDTNWYSVPRRYAFGKVTIKAYVDRIDVIHQEQIIVSHRRSYERHAKVLDPLHYLAILPRKPAVLHHADVYRNWHLPAPFSELRDKLEERLGEHTGARHYIRVLQLLAEHPAERIGRAIRHCLARGYAEARLIAEHAERLAHAEARKHSQATSVCEDLDLPEAVRNAQVQCTGLGHFDLLLSNGGDAEHERQIPVTAEGQPQGTPLADHAG